MTANPWADRFGTLSAPERIREAVRIPATRVRDFDGLSVIAAQKLLETGLKKFYLPSAHQVSLISTLVEIAIAHCRTVYTTKKAYLDEGYLDNAGFRPEFEPPTMLTGLAGGGKSQLIRALGRLLLPTSCDLHVDDNHSDFRLDPLWQLNIGTNSSIRELLSELADGCAPKALKRLISVLRKRAFKRGIALATLDESQFFTRSKAATARITALLYALMELCLPVIFVANISLHRRLLTRYQEDKQRLLGRPLELRPELCGSVDWLAYLREVKVVSQAFTNVVELQKLIHDYTFGLPRLVVELLRVAYGFARGRQTGVVVIDEQDLRAAYLSAEYASNREDVEQLREQEITGCPGKQEDLWSPLWTLRSVVMPVSAPVSISAGSAPPSKLEEQLHYHERKVLEAVRGAARGKAGAKGATELPKRRRASNEELLANTVAYTAKLVAGRRR